MDERRWRKAIQIVLEDYPEVPQGSAHWWGLVFGIYKRMQGRKPLRGLIRAGIIKKQLDNIDPVVALLSLMEPMLGAQVPISLEQLILDLPPPPTIADFTMIAPHYVQMFPQYASPRPEEEIRKSYMECPIFISLAPQELVFLLRNNYLPLNTGLVEVDEQWRQAINAFNSLWYLSLLVSLATGTLAPRSSTSFRWLIQLSTNPYYRDAVRNFFMEAIERLRERIGALRGIRWRDCLGWRHRFCQFGWNSPTPGVVLSPSRIQYVWCIKKEMLDEPVIPSSLDLKHLGEWFWLAMSGFRPALHCVGSGDFNGWVPFLSGGIENLERDCLAVVSFSDLGFNVSIPLIKVDFDTPYTEVIRMLKQHYLGGER